jgi:RNA polymerase sigma-70 factor, ECF subfamily
VIPTTREEQAQLTGLLGRIAQGEQAALGLLYDRTSPVLYGLLLRMLRRPEWAQEALQDCYLRVWQRAETYDTAKGEPIAWLIGVARYRALDLLRVRRDLDRDPVEIDTTLHDTVDDFRDFERSPEDSAVEREGLERMLRCMRGLTQVQRKSVLLAYYEGYSHTELAQAMDAPLGTVKAWIRRGLARLRECLER